MLMSDHTRISAWSDSGDPLSNSFVSPAAPSIVMYIALQSHHHQLHHSLLAQLLPEPSGSTLLLLQALDPKPSNRICILEQINLPSIARLQTPLDRLKHALGRGPVTRKAHDARVLRALDPEGDVDAAVQLVHLAADPGDLLGEVDLVAQVVAGLAGRAQRVERPVHDGRGQLLVVEDGDGAGGHDGQEDGEGAGPAEAGCFDIFFDQDMLVGLA